MAPSADLTGHKRNETGAIKLQKHALSSGETIKTQKSPGKSGKLLGSLKVKLEGFWGDGVLILYLRNLLLGHVLQVYDAFAEVSSRKGVKGTFFRSPRNFSELNSEKVKNFAMNNKPVFPGFF